MNGRTQHRSWIPGIHERAAGAALALAIMLVAAVLATGSAQAQTYTESVLYSFTGSPDGADPYAGLVQDAQGNLYGTTFEGGDIPCSPPDGCGTVFKLDTTLKETVLYSFTGTGGDGSWPAYAGLVLDAQGNLYGTTPYGGDLACFPPNGCGTVFKVDTTGTETVLYSFCSQSGCTDGAFPHADLVRDAQGNLVRHYLRGRRFQHRNGIQGGYGRQRDRALQLLLAKRLHGRRISLRRFSAGRAGQPVWHHHTGRRSCVRRWWLRNGVQAGYHRQGDRALQLPAWDWGGTAQHGPRQ